MDTAAGSCSAAAASAATVWWTNRWRGVSAQARAAGRGDDLDAEDRVPAEREVVVLGAHLVHAQHVGPDPGERLLGVRARRDVTGGRGGPVGCGQGAPVEFAGRAQRQPLQGDDDRGDQVVGQALREEGTQRGGIGARRGPCDHIAHQALVAVGLDDPSGGLGHVGVPGQRGLHLAQFDAEAAYLDLVVGPAEVLQLPLGVPAHEVAGAVHPLAGGAERVRQEAPCGQAGPREVPARHAGTGEVELAGDADRDRPQVRVEDVGAGACDGAADRRGAVRVRGVAVPGGGVDGGLGGAVDVGDPAAGDGGADLADGAGGEPLTGQHHGVRGDVDGVLGEELAQGRGDGAEQARGPGGGAFGQGQQVAARSRRSRRTAAG